MAQSLSRIVLHIVFSTKNRTKAIPENIMSELHAYLAGVCRKQGAEAYRVGGTFDHVHIACALPRTLSVSKLVEEIKKTSSAWTKAQHEECGLFSWQLGYGAFSVGVSQLQELIRYIDRQKEHHKQRSFQDEFLDLLKKYNVDYDECYLWQ